MKKVLTLLFTSVLVLALVGCGAKESTANEANSKDVSAEPKQGQISSNSKTLPASYPNEILPLAADAEIIDVRENSANNGLEVIYVSENDIRTLCDYYEGALKNAKDLSTHETSDGYVISAKIDGTDYTITLSKNAMKSNPQHAGKVSVYIILTGLESVSQK